MQATARFLEEYGVKIKAVFIGGIFAPKYIRLYGWFSKSFGFITDNSIRRFVKKAGLPREMLDNKDYLDHMRRIMKHVRLNYNKYMYNLTKSKADKVKSPLYLVVGDKDPATRNYSRRYRSWSRYFSHVHYLVLDEAEHFFINTHPDQLVDFFTNI
jgi:surfactin synthase thioesterase subunit